MHNNADAREPEFEESLKSDHGLDSPVPQNMAGEASSDRTTTPGPYPDVPAPEDAGDPATTAIIEVLRNTATITFRAPESEPLTAAIKQLLTYRRQTLEAGLQTGHCEICEERTFWSVGADGRLVISIGAIPRVRAHLEKRGHTVVVRRAAGQPRITPTRPPWAGLDHDELNLLTAVRRHSRGQIEVEDDLRTVELIAGLIRVFPDAHVAIPMTQGAALYGLACELHTMLWPDDSVGIAGGKYDDVRVLIGTFENVGAQAMDWGRRLVIFPCAEDILDRESRQWVRRLVDEHAYAFVRPALRLTDVERLVIEDVAGPLILSTFRKE
jgi:hypothetical protein